MAKKNCILPVKGSPPGVHSRINHALSFIEDSPTPSRRYYSTIRASCIGRNSCSPCRPAVRRSAACAVRIVGGIRIVHAEISGIVDVHIGSVIATPQPTGLASLTIPIPACIDTPFPAELVCRSCIRDIAINNGSRSVLLQKGKYAVASQRKQARTLFAQ